MKRYCKNVDITDRKLVQKAVYKCLRNKKDDYAFSALCVKADYYTNPALTFMDVFKEYEQ